MVGPDVLDGQPDRARLERRELRGTPKDVAVELLLDPDDVAVVLGVDRVAATAEVHEIEQGEVILQLLERDREARRELRGVERRRAFVAAGREEVCEECLQHAEALRGYRAHRAVRAAAGEDPISSGPAVPGASPA